LARCSGEASSSAKTSFAPEQARGAWRSGGEASDVGSPELRDEIAKILVQAGAADGYAVARRNVFLGQWIRHGGLYPDWQVRLFRRGCGRFVDRDVHESVGVGGRVYRMSVHRVHRSD